MDNYMLSTIDNPYSPFTQFDLWFRFDTDKGYDTAGAIARLTITSDDLSDYDQEEAISFAIEELMAADPFGVYRLVKQSDFE